MRQATLYIDEPHLEAFCAVLEEGLDLLGLQQDIIQATPHVFVTKTGVTVVVPPDLVPELRTWIEGVRQHFPNAFTAKETP